VSREDSIQKAVREIRFLEPGYSEDEARLMVKSYIDSGGLICSLVWPEEFTLFCRRKNVLDVLLANHI
jgi:hypothetical protein